MAAIFAIRPAYLAYATRDLTVTANQTKVASLPNLSYTTFTVRPGHLALSGEGGTFSWPRRDLTIDVLEGKTYYIVWVATEGNSPLVLGPDKAGEPSSIIAPIMQLDSIRWQAVTKDVAQQLLESTNYVAAESGGKIK